MTQKHLADVAELERLCFSDPWSEKALELLLGDAAIGYVCELDGRAVAYVGMMLACDEGQITNPLQGSNPHWGGSAIHSQETPEER